jgi:hypothetical protein
MATYEDWNHALAAYFTEGVPRGSTVFLSVDDDSFHAIGRSLETSLDQRDDFLRAVRRRVVTGKAVKIYTLEGRDKHGEPRCVAFLAAMVLAVSRMIGDERMTQTNYFQRLREVLGLPLDGGRPVGLDEYEELPLWAEWNRWLQEQGFLFSAREGRGSDKYIHYSRSQSLLRQADRVKLTHVLRDRQWPNGLDVEEVAALVRKDLILFSQHLHEVLDDGRQDAATASIHELYEDGAWEVDDSPGTRAPQAGRPLFAGLLRRQHIVSRESQYFFLPRRRRHRDDGEIHVEWNGSHHLLSEFRSSWYHPIGPISVADIGVGGHHPVRQPCPFHRLELPQRRFWTLVPDPEEPDSGECASAWDRVQLGQPFVLLCRQEIVDSLLPVRGWLIEWQDEPNPVPELDGWVELENCLVSDAWKGNPIADPELCDALRPRSSLNIAVSGGIRVPALNGWIEGHGPTVTVYGTNPSLDLQVRLVRIFSHQEKEIWQRPQKLNQPFSISWPKSGLYRIEAASGGREGAKLVRIAPWEEVRAGVPEAAQSVAWGGWRLSGAMLEEAL